MKILIVEDDEALGDALEAHLQNEGYDTCRCADGETGWMPVRTTIS